MCSFALKVETSSTATVRQSAMPSIDNTRCKLALTNGESSTREPSTLESSRCCHMASIRANSVMQES
eukprot:6010516-Pleurochrysis_carterae.AAC.2